MSKDNYTINIDFSASYGDDKENAGVTCSVRDSDGLNVSTHKKIDGNDIDTALAEMFDDVISSIVVSKTSKPKTKEEELQAKLDSMVIDNKVLQARLGKLQEAYDALVKINQNKCTCECRTKPSADKKVKDACPNVKSVRPKYCRIDNSSDLKYVAPDGLEFYVNELYKDVFNRFIK